MKVVIIGGETGGLTLAKHLREKNKTIEIVILEKLKYMAYEKAAMPYYISSKVDENELILSKIDTLKKVYHLDIKLGVEVLKINSETNEIEAVDIENNTMFKLNYDYLVLSVGTIAKKIPEFNDFGENVFIHRNLANAKRLKQYIDKNNPKKALIIGSGTVSLALAENLNKLGIEVHMFEKEDNVIPEFDRDMSLEVENILDNYIYVHTNTKIVKAKNIESNKTIDIHYTQNSKKEKLNVDIVIVTAGVIPATLFIKKAGIKTDDKDYVIVDKHMKTNIKNIYAIGDIAKVESTYKGIYITPGVSVSAKRQAKIAADNILGNNAEYTGSTNTMLLSVFGYQVAKTGLDESKLEQNGIEYYSKVVLGKTSSPSFKGSEELLLKCLFEKETKKIVGASAIGKKDADKKIDVLAVAIKAGFTAKDLALFELAYMPKYNESVDIINQIGFEAEKGE